MSAPKRPFLLLRLASHPTISLALLFIAALAFAHRLTPFAAPFIPVTTNALEVVMLAAIVHVFFHLVYALVLLPPSLFIPQKPKHAFADVRASFSMTDGPEALTILAKNLSRIGLKLQSENFTDRRFVFAPRFPGALAKAILAAGALVILLALFATADAYYASVVINDGTHSTLGYDRDGTPASLPFSLAYHGSGYTNNALYHSITVDMQGTSVDYLVTEGGELALENGLRLLFTPPFVEETALKMALMTKRGDGGYITLGQTSFAVGEKIDFASIPFALYATGLYPNFDRDSYGEPITKDFSFERPVVRVDVAERNTNIRSVYLHQNAAPVELYPDGYYAALTELRRNQTLTALVKSSPPLPAFFVGGALFLIGLALFYGAGQSVLSVEYEPVDGGVEIVIYGYAFSSMQHLGYTMEEVTRWLAER